METTRVCVTQGTLCSSCLLTHPAPPLHCTTAEAGLGAGRAQGSPPLLAMSSESQSPAFPRAGCRWGQPLLSACLRPLAGRHGPNTSVLIQQSIFKSQAARPRKSNYASQPCAPNANRAAFPWDIASQPIMKGSEQKVVPGGQS